jgi:ABC-2 type transport system permease protein
LRSKKRSSLTGKQLYTVFTETSAAVAMPAMFLSGLILPMTPGPGRLDVLSHFMSFRYPVDAVRDAYVGSYATASMLYGVLVALGFAGLAVTVGTRVLREV